jgi:hypothetical protein
MPLGPVRNITKFLMILIVWVLAAIVVGLLGVTLGPGVVMLFIALVWGLCGAAMSLFSEILSLRVPACYSGFAISIICAILSVALFSGGTDSIGLVFIMLFTFLVVPSYLVYFLVHAIVKRMVSRNAA